MSLSGDIIQNDSRDLKRGAVRWYYYQRCGWYIT